MDSDPNETKQCGRNHQVKLIFFIDWGSVLGSSGLNAQLLVFAVSRFLLKIIAPF